MAQIERRDDRPKPWRARVRTPEGKTVARSFERKIDAERWARDQESAKDSGEWIDPALRRLPFSHFADLWLAAVADRKPKTIEGYRSLLDCHVLPRFEATPIGAIDQPTVSAFVSELVEKGLGAGTVRNALNVVKPILGIAVAAGAVRANAATGVRPPRAEREEMRFLSAEQVERLSEAIDAPYGVLVRAAAYSGLRAGELAALRVRDVDTMRGTLHVRQSVAEVHGEAVFGSPKNGRTRSVPLPRTLVDLLTRHLADKAGSPDALVFTAPDGGVLRQSNFYRRTFKPAVAEAGLDPALRFHDLRHTCAALSIAAGSHPSVIKARLGHSSITTTLDTYGHLLPSLDDVLTDALDVRLRAAMEAQSDLARPRRDPSSVSPIDWKAASGL